MRNWIFFNIYFLSHFFVTYKIKKSKNAVRCVYKLNEQKCDYQFNTFLDSYRWVQRDLETVNGTNIAKISTKTCIAALKIYKTYVENVRRTIDKRNKYDKDIPFDIFIFNLKKLLYIKYNMKHVYVDLRWLIYKIKCREKVFSLANIFLYLIFCISEQLNSWAADSYL